ncbi:hypothetical protein [Embleya sp. NPDC020630]|uniref:hypothetical protein n=1 Tax=Embleya sp. NPDC020630 TaxID=3363979 RepID=UPI00379787FB
MEALRDGDPTRLGPYRLRGRLGEGGMGEVFLGTSPSGVRVAVKTVRPEFAMDHGFRDRFRREIDLARRVDSAWSAPVVAGDKVYVAMDATKPDASSGNAAQLPALHTKTGRIAWKAPLPSPTSSRPVAAKGNVYIAQRLRPDEGNPNTSVTAYEQ